MTGSLAVIRAAALAALPLLLAGCGERTRLVDAVITADLEAGEATVACRDSSSGACHLLFVTEVTTIPAEAKKGETASVEGLSSFTRYCIGDSAPRPADCKPQQLRNGEQIVRSSSTIG